MNRSRRLVLQSALLPLLPAAGGLAHAQSWPERPVRIVVGFPAGGVADIWARLIATPLQAALGQPVVVVNQVGASGQISLASVAKAAPDGYTLVVGATGPLATTPALKRNLPYDPRRDFATVGMIGNFDILLMAHPGFPANTAGETIEYARRNPGKLRFAIGSPGAAMHLLAAKLVKETGIDVTWVPYKGTAQAIADLVGGTVQVLVDGLPAAIPQIRAGRLKALAVASDSRLSVLPHTPTLAEAGFEGYAATSWISLNAPAATPREVLLKLNAELNKILKSPAVGEVFAKQSSRPVAMPLDQAHRFILSEQDRWAKIVVDTGVKLE